MARATLATPLVITNNQDVLSKRQFAEAFGYGITPRTINPSMCHTFLTIIILPLFPKASDSITIGYGRSSGLFLSYLSFPTRRQMRVSGFEAVSTENTAAGTVAESHGIPYFETITSAKLVQGERKTK